MIETTIHLRRTGGAMCTVVDATNNPLRDPPHIVRGVPVTLRVFVFDGDAATSPASLAAAAWQAFAFHSWKGREVPRLRAGSVSVALDGALECVFAEMNTEELHEVVDGRPGVPLFLEVDAIEDGNATAVLQWPVVCDNRGDSAAGEPTPLPPAGYSRAETEAAIASAIASAQGVTRQAVAHVSGDAVTVSPGCVYDIAPTADFTLAAAACDGYAEALVFVTPGEWAFGVADGIALDAEMEAGRRYRLLVSWTPFGIHVEQTGEWGG